MTAALDWSAPWMLSLQRLGRPVQQALDQGLPVWQALQQVAQAHDLLAGWQFVPQQALPAGMAYEVFIHAQRCIPTRDHLHDLLNGLIWLHWPRSKARFNAMQAQAIAEHGVAARRGALRDAITVLDENGALLLAPPALCQALQARDWQALFVQQRGQWEQARLLPLGHALLEKLVRPRKPITAHVLCVPWPAGTQAGPAPALDAPLDQIDAWLAHSPWLQAQQLAHKPFSPLPVLGVPGWCSENQNFCFYDDSLVFRAAHAPQSTYLQACAAP